MNELVKLIYIGDLFYHKSGTMMSSIYTEDGRRYDWGYVNSDLRNGKSVEIRPATADELEYYKQKLVDLSQHVR